MAKKRRNGVLFILLGVGALLALSQLSKAEPSPLPGPKGDKGDKGDRGTILTSGNDIASAPLDALEGDLFLVLPTGDLYEFTGGTWL